MAQQFTSLIKFRRGTKEKRLITKFQEGEPVFEVDTRRMFIGVGDNDDANIGPDAIGGIPVSNLTFTGLSDTNPDRLTEPRAYTGDLIYANKKIWQYNSNNSIWTDISPKADEVTIAYNEQNQLFVRPEAFTVKSGDGITVTEGSTVSITNSDKNILKFNTDNELTLPKNSITADYLASNFFNNNQFIKNADTWSLNLSQYNFKFANTIKIDKVPAGLKDDVTIIAESETIGTVNAIINDRFRDISTNQSTGLIINNTSDLAITPSLKVLNNTSGNIEGLKLGINNILIGNDQSIKTFNGSISQNINNFKNSVRQEVIVYDSDNTSAIVDFNKATLLSGGFIVVDNGISKNDRAYRRFAIPVYDLPKKPDVLYFTNTVNNIVVKGSDLATGKVYINHIDGSRTNVHFNNFAYDTNTEIYTLTFGLPIVIAPGEYINIETISGTSLFPINNGPRIFKITSTGTVTNPIFKLTGYNIPVSAADILLTYNLYNEPEINVPVSLVDADIKAPVNNLVEINYNLGASSPQFNDINGFTITVNGLSDTFIFEYD